MQIKEIKRQINRSLALNSLKFFCVVLRILPKCFIYAFAEFTAYLGYFIAVKQRRIAQESLKIAFGGAKSPKEIKVIVKTCFLSIAKGLLEMMVSIDNPELLDNLVSIEGKENLDKALSKGKGVVVVSGHFGNFPLLLTKLAVLGYKVNLLVRKMRDENADEYFNKKRLALGVKSIYTHPRNACISESIAALRNNEIVFTLMDQNFGSRGGVFVDFFGRKAATATGSVIFSLRTGASIVPAFIVRNPDGRTHRLIIEPVLELVQDPDKQKTIEKTVAKITSIIEKYIREYPAEWGWIHRRWKSQPQNKVGR